MLNHPGFQLSDQKADLQKAKSIGVPSYNLEQEEKMQILARLLAGYNDGRRKNFYCVAVNLLELSEIQEAMNRIESNDRVFASAKERCAYAAEVFQEIADRKKIKLKLIRK